ncbi:MAG: hypothetical protein KIT33_15105 [Candidatus Kapabacteria bacterium]|nr:hypothetical protein [Ignavibacteriota bacterium]MCW5886298.1 hypothetical protein [Candidatus Kapabacteria bacterium]
MEIITAQEFRQKYVKLKEHDLQDTICDILIAKRFLVIRFNSGSFLLEDKSGKKRYYRSYFIKNIQPVSEQSSGISDVAFMRNGKIWFVEAKRPGQAERKSQLKFRKIAEEYGMTVFKISNLEELLEELKRI